MPSFSIIDAALEGLKLTRERPWAICAWSVLYLAIGVLSTTVMVWAVGPDFATTLSTAVFADPNRAEALAAKLAPAYAIIAPTMLVGQSVVLCAVYRAVLRPDSLVGGHVKFGRNELRVAAVNLTVAAAFAGVLIGGELVAALLSAIPGLSGPPITSLVLVASLLAIFWLAVRISLAGPATFASETWNLAGAWAMSRGQFWRLVAAYALSMALALVIWLLAWAMFWKIAQAGVLLAGRPVGDTQHLFEPTTASLKAYLTPEMILFQVFSAVLTTLVNTVLMAPPAVAYAALRRGAATATVSVYPR